MKHLLTLAIGLVFLVSCSHDPVVPQTPVLTFEKDIQPITLNNCARAGCHVAGGESPTLVSYGDIMGQVKAGDPKSSKLFRIITNLTPGVGMPPSNPLADQQVNLIYVWILQGAKEK
jgi:hypothetical protein